MRLFLLAQTTYILQVGFVYGLLAQQTPSPHLFRYRSINCNVPIFGIKTQRSDEVSILDTGKRSSVGLSTCEAWSRH
jgi:hypothetical protein